MNSKLVIYFAVGIFSCCILITEYDAAGQSEKKRPRTESIKVQQDKTSDVDLLELKKRLAAAVEAGKLTEEEALKKYEAIAGGKELKKPSNGKATTPAKKATTPAKKDSSAFLKKLTELVESGKLSKQDATELYNSVIKSEPLDGSKKLPKKGVNGADYKINSLEEQKRLSKILPMTSTGDEREGPVACGFFGWAADATHRFMDNSHQGSPRMIHGLSFRLDHRDHDTIGRTWENITIRVAHGDWSTIKYNTSREYKLLDDEQVVFSKEWSFPTLKGQPALKPAQWGGPQNCLNFRFDKPFKYNGKDAIYIEFVFSGGTTEDGREWEGDLPYGFEYFLDSMPEAGGWRQAEGPRGLYRPPRVEAVVSYTAGGQSVWTSSAKGMPYLNWEFKAVQ